MEQPRRKIQDRSFDFALRIVRLHEYLSAKRGAARVIARQMLRSGTSVGANLEEASAAQSKPDFISKCSIAAKEARETRYWLRLLTGCRSMKQSRIAPLIEESSEIVAILTAIVKNAESSLRRNSTFTIQH
jgi:four helix bundle protein